MKEKSLSAVLLVLIVAIANTASVDLKGWLSALQNVTSINFYKQILVYEQAILQEGIPALNIPPYDPCHIDAKFSTFQDSYESYTNIEIALNGFFVYDFSNFDIITAELDVEAMKANLFLYQDDTKFTNNDLRVTAVDYAGRPVSCNCTYVEGGVLRTTFSSVKELEVVGPILKVKQFDFAVRSDSVYIEGPYDCTGDVEILKSVSDILRDRLYTFAHEVIPEKLNELAANITTVLNDIFALRNITYEDDSTSTDQSSLTEVHQQGSELSQVDSNKPDKIIRRAITRADHESSKKVMHNNPIIMTWE